MMKVELAVCEEQAMLKSVSARMIVELAVISLLSTIDKREGSPFWRIWSKFIQATMSRARAILLGRPFAAAWKAIRRSIKARTCSTKSTLSLHVIPRRSDRRLFASLYVSAFFLMRLVLPAVSTSLAIPIVTLRMGEKKRLGSKLRLQCVGGGCARACAAQIMPKNWFLKTLLRGLLHIQPCCHALRYRTASQSLSTNGPNAILPQRGTSLAIDSLVEMQTGRTGAVSACDGGYFDTSHHSQSISKCQ